LTGFDSDELEAEGAGVEAECDSDLSEGCGEGAWRSSILIVVGGGEGSWACSAMRAGVFMVWVKKESKLVSGSIPCGCVVVDA